MAATLRRATQRAVVLVRGAGGSLGVAIQAPTLVPQQWGVLLGCRGVEGRLRSTGPAPAAE